MKNTVWIVGLFFAGAVATASANELSDDAVRQAVESKLEKAKIGDGVGPVVTVKDGVVTLTGQVRSLWAKNAAIAAAMDIHEVDAVEDELTIAEGESDQKVAEAIANVIRGYPFFTVYDDVVIAVENGQVNLDGRVTMPFKSSEIGKRVSKVMGVQGLNNAISTLPTNIGDQKIRANLAYRIYSNTMFREYAYRANPPIHIIVERGRVALTGAVRTEVEKRRAEHIARQTFGVFRVENRLTVGD